MSGSDGGGDSLDMRRPRKQRTERRPGGFSLEGMVSADSDVTVTSMSGWQRRPARTSQPDRLYTIKEVGDACGLPGPVVMQLVPRTWTDDGWMYTGGQLDAAVLIAGDLRRDLAATAPKAPPTAVLTPVDWLVCDRCGSGVAAGTEAATAWFAVVESIGRVGADTVVGQDFCPRCVTPCPECGEQAGNRLCPQCFGTGRIPMR
jgi:hypothetical protein